MPDEPKTVPEPTAVFLDTCLVFGRYITVRNIETVEDEGERVAVYKNLNELLELIEANPAINDYTFDQEQNAWKITKRSRA